MPCREELPKEPVVKGTGLCDLWSRALPDMDPCSGLEDQGHQ